MMILYEGNLIIQHQTLNVWTPFKLCAYSCESMYSSIQLDIELLTSKILGMTETGA